MEGTEIQLQGGGGTAKRISMHAQLACRLALVAIVRPQHRSDEGLPELPNSFSVENPAPVHPAYKCIDFAAHGHDPFDVAQNEGGEQATPAGDAPSITQIVCRRVTSRSSGKYSNFHSCTKSGH